MLDRPRTSRRLCALFCCVVIVMAPPLVRADDTLNALRETVRTPPVPDAPAAPAPAPAESSSNSRNNSSSSDNWLNDWDDDDGTLTKLLIIGVGAGVTSPFWAPPMLMRDDGDFADFADFPHAHRRGYLEPHWLQEGSHGEELERNFWSIRPRVEYGTNFSDIDWVGANVLAECAPRFGVDADVRWLKEERLNLPRDSATIGDCNVCYRFAQCPRAEIRAGLGFNYLTDATQTDLGFNFTYAGDWYPTKPVVVSSEFDLGWLGHAAVTHVRVTTGVNVRHVEAFFGYDSYHIGNFEVEGLVSGLRAWY